MDYLPISLNVKARNCLVVGGGNIAIRKARQLISAGATVTAVAPDFHPDFIQQQSEGLINLIHSQYNLEQLQDKLLVIAATDNSKINKQVHHDAESAGILVNVVDQPELCRFIVPSIVDRTPLTIAISTGGSGPVFARMLREKLEWLLPDNIGEFLAKVNADRSRVAEKWPDMPERREFWERFFERELGWNTAYNVSNSNNETLNLDYQLFQSEQPTSQAHLALIDFGRANINDLSVSIIAELQKVDNLYISQTNYQKLKDFIRRDADIHVLQSALSDHTEVNNLISGLSLAKGRSVVLNEGHLFEQFDSELSDLISKQQALNYTRLGIAKY
jgi:uroporphyrin-III C-methyltransferase / precorrin-2 dehydrogenase / sirohydrochlorin ferrochelatase